MCKIDFDMKVENVSAKVIPTVKFKHIAISGDPFFVGRIGGFQPDDEVHLINGQ